MITEVLQPHLPATGWGNPATTSQPGKMHLSVLLSGESGRKGASGRGGKHTTMPESPPAATFTGYRVTKSFSKKAAALKQRPKLPRLFFYCAAALILLVVFRQLGLLGGDRSYRLISRGLNQELPLQQDDTGKRVLAFYFPQFHQVSLKPAAELACCNLFCSPACKFEAPVEALPPCILSSLPCHLHTQDYPEHSPHQCIQVEENDKFWGPGFTDHTNLKKARKNRCGIGALRIWE